jgi:hypothetical protein
LGIEDSDRTLGIRDVGGCVTIEYDLPASKEVGNVSFVVTGSPVAACETSASFSNPVSTDNLRPLSSLLEVNL